MKITVVGGGYVGLVSGSCLAGIGHDVSIIDTIPEKVRMINEKRPPIYEIGLEDILKKHAGVNLSASVSYDSVSESDVILIAVGTPPKEDGSANLEYIRSAAESIGRELKKSHKYNVVAVKSTVPPGTTLNVVKKTVLETSGKSESEIGFVMNPEFLREGLAVEDFMNPDRIVIGGDGRAAQVVKEMYAPLKCENVLITQTTAAEMIKYTSNAFLAAKISFSNEIGNLCKQLGIDVYDVMKGVGMDKRISPHFLNAGCGFGGSCFPKDVSALVSLAESMGQNPLLLKSVLEINEKQPLKMIELLKKKIGTVSGKKIAVLGLAFKNDTDDIRDSRSIPVIDALLQEGAAVSCYDRMAAESMKKLFSEDKYNITYHKSAKDALTGADAALVMTEWPEFTKLGSEFDVMKEKIIIEGRRILSVTDKEGICW